MEYGAECVLAVGSFSFLGCHLRLSIFVMHETTAPKNMCYADPPATVTKQSYATLWLKWLSITSL